MFGGWRIVKTMGQRITKLKPVGGFCAETGGAITLFLATAWAFRCPPPTPSPARSSAWARAARQRRALGRGRQHRLGLDFHHSGQRFRGDRGLLD